MLTSSPVYSLPHLTDSDHDQSNRMILAGATDCHFCVFSPETRLLPCHHEVCKSHGGFAKAGLDGKQDILCGFCRQVSSLLFASLYYRTSLTVVPSSLSTPSLLLPRPLSSFTNHLRPLVLLPNLSPAKTSSLLQRWRTAMSVSAIHPSSLRLHPAVQRSCSNHQPRDAQYLDHHSATLT